MAKQRFNSGNGDYYSGFRPAGGGQSGNYPYARGMNNQNIVKRSGATFGTLAKGKYEGKPYVSAWKKDKRGFFVLYARPYEGTKVKENKLGTKDWMNLFVTITNRTTMQSYNCSGLLDMGSKRLYIKDLNQVVSRGGKGGYWGIHVPSKSMTR
ncbi:MAG: hypothetical protein ACK5KV_03020 [Bacteroides graminisolvens]|uniref:hypothetical protein n=1 Tax=Bacteroides graminisolvens TaxID=477666 RepID=UPI003A8914B9